MTQKMLGMVLDAVGSRENWAVGPSWAVRFTYLLLILPVQTSDTRYGKDLHLQLSTEAGLPNYL